VSFAKNIVFDCDGSTTSSIYFNGMYHFMTTDIYNMYSHLALTDKNLSLHDFKKMNFVPLSVGVYGDAVISNGIRYGGKDYGTTMRIYRQKGNKLDFLEIYKQENGRIPTVSKVSDAGIIVCYEKELKSTHTIVLYKPSQNKFAESKDSIPSDWRIHLPGSIIPVASSGDFFIVGNLLGEKHPAIFRFDADCVLRETRTLDEIMPGVPFVDRLAGRMLTSDSVLFWGEVEPAQWWFAVYDLKKNLVIKMAVVPPGYGIMPELIYSVVVLEDGRLCLCTPSTLFMLSADFALEGYWTAEQEAPPGFESVSITADGNLLVLGSTLVERGGKAAVWLISPQDFTPLPRKH
jgi:hypothetical protein